MKKIYLFSCCLALLFTAYGTANKVKNDTKASKMKQLEKNKFIRHEMIGTINITPLFPGREKEVIADVKDMYSKDVIARAAFIVYLLPDGYPEPADLATPQAKVFAQYKAMLHCWKMV